MIRVFTFGNMYFTHFCSRKFGAFKKYVLEMASRKHEGRVCIDCYGAMSVTRCDTVTHGADHTHDVGSVSANQRSVWGLQTNERPV